MCLFACVFFVFVHVVPRGVGIVVVGLCVCEFPISHSASDSVGVFRGEQDERSLCEQTLELRENGCGRASRGWVPQAQASVVHAN